MRPALPIVFALVGWTASAALVGWTASAALAQPLSPPPPSGGLDRLILADPERPAPVTEARLRAHLEVRAAALRDSDAQGADLALGLLEEARHVLGAPNVVLGAALLVEEAQAFRDRGALETALERVRRAIRLAPDLLAAHWLEVSLLVEQDSTRVARIGHAVSRMARAWIRGFRNQVHLASLVAAAILVGLMIAVGLLALVLLLRHLRFQAHDLSLGLPRIVGGGEMTLVLLLAIVVPGAVGLGWPATVSLALGLTLAYQSGWERALAVPATIVVAASPWIAGLAAPLLAFHGSRVDHLARVSEEAFVGPSERSLVAHLADHPGDTLTALVLGVRAARGASPERARRFLAAAVESDPDDEVALNDLAVVEYRLGEHDEAEAHFRRAATGRRAEPHLNLSLITIDRGDFEGAQTHLGKARDLDPDLVDAVIGKAGLPTESRLSLISVPAGRFWKALYALPPEEVGATRAQLWRMVGGPVREWSIPAWGLLALAIGLLGFRRLERSGPCPRCGAPALAGAAGAQCTQCQSVFGGASAVAPQARARKEQEVRGHQLRRRWTERSAAIVPGLGALIAGRPFVGFVQLLLFSIVLALGALRWAVGVHAWHVPGEGSGSAIVSSAVIAVIVVLSLISLQRAFAR